MVKELTKNTISDFKEIYDNYCDRFYESAISICGNSTEAEDIVQDSFIKIFKKIDTIRNPDKLENWMYKILINTAKTSVTRLWRKIESFEKYHDQLHDIDKPEKIESWAVYLNILQRVPMGCRNVFILHAIQEIPQSDVSAILGISIGTVKSQYFKAKQILSNRLYESGVISEKR